MADIFNPNRRWRWAVGSEHGYLTGHDLRALLEFIRRTNGPSQMEIASYLAVPSVTHRKADRALQILRKAGFIRFDRKSRCWLAEEGRDA